MPSNVRSITHHTDANRMRDAADTIRTSDRVDAGDLADLLEAVAQAVATVSDPPLGETEMFRWSKVVMVGRRISKQWAPR